MTRACPICFPKCEFTDDSIMACKQLKPNYAMILAQLSQTGADRARFEATARTIQRSRV